MAYGTADLLRNAAVVDVTATTAPLGETTAKALVVVGPTGGSANQIQGNVAAGAVDAGNPVKVGGRFSSTLPTLTNGQRGDVQLSLRGALLTGFDVLNEAPHDGNGDAHFIRDHDGVARTVGVLGYNWNQLNSTAVMARGDSSASFTKQPPLAGTDRSVTATTTSQQLMAANTARTRFYIRNDSAIDIWVNLGAAAVASAGSGNIKIPATGGYWEFAGSSSAIHIIAASGTPAITAREF